MYILPCQFHLAIDSLKFNNKLGTFGEHSYRGGVNIH